MEVADGERGVEREKGERGEEGERDDFLPPLLHRRFSTSTFSLFSSSFSRPPFERVEWPSIASFTAPRARNEEEAATLGGMKGEKSDLRFSSFLSLSTFSNLFSSQNLFSNSFRSLWQKKKKNSLSPSLSLSGDPAHHLGRRRHRTLAQGGPQGRPQLRAALPRGLLRRLPLPPRDPRFDGPDGRPDGDRPRRGVGVRKAVRRRAALEAAVYAPGARRGGGEQRRRRGRRRRRRRRQGRLCRPCRRQRLPVLHHAGTRPAPRPQAHDLRPRRRGRHYLHRGRARRGRGRRARQAVLGPQAAGPLGRGPVEPVRGYRPEDDGAGARREAGERGQGEEGGRGEGVEARAGGREGQEAAELW